MFIFVEYETDAMDHALLLSLLLLPRVLSHKLFALLWTIEKDVNTSKDLYDD